MGVDYYYLNQDKNQYFCCGILNGSARRGAIGRGLAARALGLLLSQGSWYGDRIAVVADTSTAFEEQVASGTNIEIEVEIMLIEIEGVGIVEGELDKISAEFARLCEIAMCFRHPVITQLLDKHFGAGKWIKKYEHYVHTNTRSRGMQDAIDAFNRQLKLY